MPDGEERITWGTDVETPVEISIVVIWMAKSLRDFSIVRSCLRLVVDK